MKKMILRFRAIVLLLRLGWNQPNLFDASVFKCMSNLMEMLMVVAKDGQPRMTKLAIVVATEQHDIVTIWAGRGASASPHDRIVELRAEIDVLKAQLDRKT